LPVATDQRTQIVAEISRKIPDAVEALRAVRGERARRHHLNFMRAAWQKPGEPLIVGRHTSAICERIDQAIERYRHGESSFLILMVPFRHGKSDMVSRYLPPKFLGEFPDAEVLLATYGADLAGDLSRFARRIMDSPEYAGIFSGVAVARDSSAVDRWGIEGRTGGMVAAGLGGAITGRGYALGIVDDYLKNRADAESRLMRDRIWDSFTNDFLTRRAPVSITIVLATPWHVDDLIGRVQKIMGEDPAFPRFELLRFPAFDESYPGGVLFLERFSREWYDQQRASLGSYGTASLMQCDPVQHHGNLLKISRVQIIDSAPEGLTWVRFWDPASTMKTVMKPDPDYTVGGKCAIRMIKNAEGSTVPQLIVADVRRGRWEAPERDRIIVQTAKIDGPGVHIGVEAAGGYKDTYTRIVEVLKGTSRVDAVYPATDKLVRASPLEPIFEAGNVLLVRGEWNQEYLDECAEFPSGAHDDQVDMTSGAYAMLMTRRPSWGVA
jgi:predicted phage terminase large subunit-like protein